MINIRVHLTALMLIIVSLQANADEKNALFLGNSYTFFNTLPAMVSDIATSLGDTLNHDSSTPPGYTAQQHTTNTTTLAKIAQGGWDYVSIQCQSQEPSFSTAQVMAQTYPYVMFLDSAIEAGNNCAETLFFMTWGRQNGDTQNYPNDTYDAMQQRLRNGYTMFADSANASIAPVGAAWKVMRDQAPTINLYNADGSHPSINGTYLAACVFYCSIFKKSCVGSMYLPGGVGNGDAFVMQQIASDVVLDSLETWHGEGGIPDASFTYTAASQNSINFNNTSLRYQSSSWNFGDGTPINNNQNPLHLFPTTTGGTYTVCLTVSSACGKTDSSCQTVMVGPSNTSSFSTTDQISISKTQNQLNIHSELNGCSLNLYDIKRRKIVSQELPLGASQYSLSSFAQGVYILQIKKDNQLLKREKLWNN